MKVIAVFALCFAASLGGNMSYWTSIMCETIGIVLMKSLFLSAPFHGGWVLLLKKSRRLWMSLNGWNKLNVAKI